MLKIIIKKHESLFKKLIYNNVFHIWHTFWINLGGLRDKKI